MALPFLIPVLFTGAGTAIGAYWEAKNQLGDATLPQSTPLMGLSATQIAYYSALGLGVYWLAKKTGAIK